MEQSRHGPFSSFFCCYVLGSTPAIKLLLEDFSRGLDLCIENPIVFESKTEIETNGELIGSDCYRASPATVALALRSDWQHRL
ncbi:hypothetical protein WK26_04835 [Burkholderia vietnamiensis]|uniref:Uncharacterized protein n=1 Tax=Burkholderia ubonensis TaxID=101571 RepID=A0A1B4LA78_9BURK|nr:hypothetical protein WJ35_02610 [Burkholderia ubonensis]AOK10351.1 hypothetical protein WK31_08930 [Burkholderia vietnamiensis]KVR85826.1 hypothetical protein WK26_04835 [Burkholderia vietnamiensis]CAG9220255.1 conserved hypothetical protein [Burkholderia vietnamiensis]